MRNLTIDQVRNAAKRHRYLLLRYDTGEAVAINSLCMIFKENAGKNGNDFTRIIGYSPIGFQEYISKKIGFFKDKKDERTR